MAPGSKSGAILYIDIFFDCTFTFNIIKSYKNVFEALCIFHHFHFQPTYHLTRILGVNRSTTNILVRGEIGRHSLQANILNRNINYIKYVENKCNTTLVKQALNYEQTKMECRPTILCLLKNHEKGLSTHLKRGNLLN